MDDTQMNQMHMGPYMHNTFWHEDQVCITFQFGYNIIPVIPTVPISGDAPREEPRIIIAPTFNKTDAIRSMNLDTLNNFLMSNHFSLSSFRAPDTLRPIGSTASDMQADLNSEIGKYLFTTKDDQGNFVPTVISFFNFTQLGQAQATVAHSFADMTPMFGMAPTPVDTTPMPEAGKVKSDDNDEPEDHDKDDKGGNGQGPANSPVVKLVTLINDHLQDLGQQGIPIVAASPIWLAGATDNGGPYGSRGVGCPLTPPIPVSEEMECSFAPGRFPITLPELPSILRPMTGDGVTVFVLDTLPKPEEINRAVEAAEEENLLLLDVANNAGFHYTHLPESLEIPGKSQPVTGKDINGKLVGYRMPDHGLFVAGIVRDLAPNANLECIRVLNDYCVGDLPTITKALETIQHRMLLVNPELPKPDGTFEQGDLFHKPVVVNMSLVIPPDNEVTSNGFNQTDLDNLHKGLLASIKSLVNLGVVFVASAGNEGDIRYPPANPTKIRRNALYPAYFAYNGLDHLGMMIPVGAVDKDGKAASYSCYPGPLGIATYGGEVPTAAGQKLNGCYTQAEKIDAPIGLYSSLSYPSLSIDDCEPTYPARNANAWAYWTGTSFATPIITAVVARILEYILRQSPPGTAPSPNTHVWNGLTKFAAKSSVTWDRLEPDFRTEIGPMIFAVQCASAGNEEEQEQVEVEVVNVTINEYNQQ